MALGKTVSAEGQIRSTQQVPFLRAYNQLLEVIEEEMVGTAKE